MARYSIFGETIVGTDECILCCRGAATVRAKIYDLIIGSDASPQDLATDFAVRRTTDAGTTPTTTFTPVALDPLTVASSSAGLVGSFVTDPADTANSEMLKIHLNQRATFRWVAAPGSELVTTAAANNGIAIFSVASGGTYNVGVTMLFEE